jgi:hypothetical protein
MKPVLKVNKRFSCRRDVTKRQNVALAQANNRVERKQSRHGKRTPINRLPKTGSLSDFVVHELSWCGLSLASAVNTEPEKTRLTPGLFIPNLWTGMRRLGCLLAQG